MKKFLCGIFCSIFFAGSAFGFAFQQHNSFQNQYVWGLTTEASRTIHSGIIDRVPWRNYTGGGLHRDLWGHSPEWFYQGKIPKVEAIKDIKSVLLKNNPKILPSDLEREAEKIFKEAVSMSCQERIARELMNYAPSLTKKEAMLMAEQNFASHIAADSTTSEGAKMSSEFVERMKNLLRSPKPEALSAYNKRSIQEAILKQGENFSPEVFAGQSTNFARPKAEFYAGKGYEIYNPAGRNDIEIIKDGENYIIRRDANNIKNVLERNPNAKVILPDDEYEKFLKSKNFNDVPKNSVVCNFRSSYGNF